jgi:hypothetical protein
MKIVKKIIIEKPGPGRLGRHIEHDPQSRAFSVGTAAVKTVTYKRHGKPFDQGELGSCTGNAMAGVLMTEPLWVPGRDLTGTMPSPSTRPQRSSTAFPANIRRRTPGVLDWA